MRVCAIMSVKLACVDVDVDVDVGVGVGVYISLCLSNVCPCPVSEYHRSRQGMSCCVCPAGYFSQLTI